MEKNLKKIIFPQKCREEELNHRKTIASLIDRNRTTATTYKSLDEKINSVATKVVHLGDQLESVNTPRYNKSNSHKKFKSNQKCILNEMY